MSSSKRKLVLSILILAFVLLGAFSMVSLVFALTEQNIKSPLSLAYESQKDVYATIKGGLFHDNLTTPIGNSINIELKGEGTAGSLTFQEYTIEPPVTDPSVYINLNIKNTQEKNSNPELYVAFSFTASTSENMTTERLVSFNDETNYEVFTETYIRIQRQQTAYMRLKFTINDLAYAANVNGTVNLNLYTASSTSLPEDVATSTIAGVGHYPQAYVGNTLNETLKAATLTATGKSYTTDVNGTETTLTEYTYQGKKVAKLTNSSIWKINDDDILTFSTGETISASQIYFFYVQPIKVTARQKVQDNIVYETKQTLISRKFDSGNNSWENSDARTFLNGTFFTESGITALEMTISNKLVTDESTTALNNTNDKVWLPSKDDLTNWHSTEGADMMRYPTDLSLATYASCRVAARAGYYWTRTAYSSTSSSTIVWDVNSWGWFSSASGSYNKNIYNYSICFAM